MLWVRITQMPQDPFTSESHSVSLKGVNHWTKVGLKYSFFVGHSSLLSISE